MKTRGKILNLIQSTREGRREMERRVACSERSRGQVDFHSNVEIHSKGPSVETGTPKWWLAGEHWVLVPESEGGGGYRDAGEGEPLFLGQTWSRVVVCKHVAREPGLPLAAEKGEDQRARITYVRVASRVASVQPCLRAPVLSSMTDVLSCLEAFATMVKTYQWYLFFIEEKSAIACWSVNGKASTAHTLWHTWEPSFGWRVALAEVMGLILFSWCKWHLCWSWEDHCEAV